MNYQAPSHINKDKLFLVNRSEITNRLDAHYNKPSYSKLWALLSRQAYELGNLRNNSIGLFSGTTPRSGGDAYVSAHGIPFVRSGDFSPTNTIDFSQLLQLRREIHDGSMRQSQLKKGDLLIAIVGATIGKVGVYQYDEEANINQAICAVRLKDNLNPYYVQAFFQTNVGQKILERIKRPVARANINVEEVGNLPVPMLDGHKQLEIVRIVEKARLHKQEKDFAAQQLLDSIDAYILHELGITIPQIENNLESRLFLTSFKDITGNRFDPYYKLYFNDSYKSVKYDSTRLSSIADICKGTALTSKDIIPGDIPVIAGGKSSPYSHNEANFMGNVITVSASGAYAGYVWYHQNPIFATDCCVISSKDESVFLTRYIAEVLKSIQTIIYRLQVGAAQPHVYPTDLMNIYIPVITISQQKTIIDEVCIIRKEAEHLQEEGKNILENAQKEVEQMIIG